MNDKVISVLHIHPGPVYFPKDMLEKRYLELSKFSQGTFVSINDDAKKLDIGKFKVRLAETKGKYGFLISLRLFFVAFIEAAKLKKNGHLDLVVCYDPLKTGLIGLFIKLVFCCKLIVEVNGVYSSPVLYQDKSNQKFKRLFYSFIQSTVLRRANGIKQLFPEQVSSFSHFEFPIIETYFNYTQVNVKEYASSPNSKIILSVGFPVKVKGIDILIEAFTKIKDKYPGWTLKIVGHFSKIERKWLEEKKRDRSILIESPVPFKEIGNLIDTCEIFVLASRTEAMGRVLVEAMARGKARVGSNVDGIPTVINDGVDGLLVRPEDHEDLAEKLAHLIESKDRREALGAAGLERFKMEFDVNTYGLKTKNFYDRVLSSG